MAHQGIIGLAHYFCFMKIIQLKHIFLLGVSFIIGIQAFSQSDTTAPIYIRYPEVPKFTIDKASDSTGFTRDDLKKHEPVVFMIFSPECEHCQHETEKLLANIDKFKDKNVQIVMVTYLPYDSMAGFYKKYKIADYPEITMGRDGKFFFPVFFKVRNLPSFYVYDKKGKFIKSFEGSVNTDLITDLL